MSEQNRNRDDFTAQTKTNLAKRVSYLCSKPDCEKTTVGPHSDGKNSVNIGVAAHIKAAAPNGKRYDPSMTSEERKDISNGIWLCQDHAKLIDSDEAFYTVELLHNWKRQAEDRSFAAIASGTLKLQNGAPSNDQDIQSVFSSLLGFCKADVLSFQQATDWPPLAIQLNLKLTSGESKQDLSPAGMALSTNVFSELGVIAPPGTGKTTTLLQVAESIITEGICAPIFIPLSEWSTGTGTMFESILRRPTFKNVQEAQLILLAEHGRLGLVLDGWNELDDSSKRRARNEIKSLQRGFPDLRIIISSRSEDLDFPIDGPVVEVGTLTEEQQVDLAKAIRPEDGEKLVDHARRTPGLRDLIGIPLYLTALLRQTTGNSLPKTKEEVLRLFVESAEQEPAKRASLRQTMQGMHRDYLEAVAVKTTSAKATALSDSQARATLNLVQERLKNENQIAQLVQPMDIIADLINAHLLVRSGSGAIAFQHQQFQEWFASFYVESLMTASFSGDVEARKTLREKVLDIPFWQEAILFACERLSDNCPEGAIAVASTIIETLGIDPMLAAEMIYRSSEAAWGQMSATIISFAKAWHSTGKVDRAFRFMITTGRSEFSDQVWPLIASSDSQLRLSSLRSVYPFKPNVLGIVQKKIETLSEDVREDIVSEIARNSRMDGIELATSLALVDSSIKVKASVVESLTFRRADRFVGQILAASPNQLWRELAEDWHPHDFSDPKIAARIEEEASKIDKENPDPIRSLNAILRANVRQPEKDAQVKSLIEEIDFSKKGQDTHWLVARVSQLYPDAIAIAILSNLESGKEIPYQAEEILFGSQIIIDSGPLVDKVVKEAAEVNTVIAAVAGPKTINLMIDELLKICREIKANGKYDSALSDQYHRLVNRISKTKADTFAEALLSRSISKEPSEIAVFAELVARHGRRNSHGPINFVKEDKERITKLLDEWGRTLLRSPQATRAEFAEIAQAAERLGSPELIPVLLDLLSEDLKRRMQAQDEHRKARQERRDYHGDAQMSWTEQYKRAFGAIDGDQTVSAMKDRLRNYDFGLEAAIVLKMIWQRSQSLEDSRTLRPSPDFSVLPEALAKRQSGKVESHPFFLDILDVIKDLIKSGSTEQDHRHAIKLATVAFGMPYADCNDTISSLLQLPIPISEKCGFLTTLALSGQVLSSQLVLSGIDNLLEEAKIKTWLMDQDGWRLKEWLQLLAFTEKPALIMDVLKRAENFNTVPWNLREILFALAYAPSTEAEIVLDELAQQDTRLLYDYDWSIALLRRKTLTAAKILLDHCTRLEKSNDGGALAKALSTLITSQTGFRREIYERYEHMADGPERYLIEQAIADVADEDGILLLLQIAAKNKKSFGATTLSWAIQQFLLDRSSTGTKANGSQTAGLRRKLFGLLLKGNSEESLLAKRSLVIVDDILDEDGRLEIESRHPDILSGARWPQVDGFT